MARDRITPVLKHYGVPLTRENYLEFAYGGEPPQHLSPEEEAELPTRYRLPEKPEDAAPSLLEEIEKQEGKK